MLDRHEKANAKAARHVPVDVLKPGNPVQKVFRLIRFFGGGLARVIMKRAGRQHIIDRMPIGKE